jgi:hypothetical protein
MQGGGGGALPAQAGIPQFYQASQRPAAVSCGRTQDKTTAPSTALLQAVSRDPRGKLVAKLALVSAGRPDEAAFLRMLEPPDEELEAAGSGGRQGAAESMAGSESGGLEGTRLPGRRMPAATGGVTRGYVTGLRCCPGFLSSRRAPGRQRRPAGRGARCACLCCQASQPRAPPNSPLPRPARRRRAFQDRRRLRGRRAQGRAGHHGVRGAAAGAAGAAAAAQTGQRQARGGGIGRIL